MNHELKIYEETENKNKQREKQRLKQKYKQGDGLYLIFRNNRMYRDEYESEHNESDDDMDDIYLSHNPTAVPIKRNEDNQTKDLKKTTKKKQEDPPITLDEINKCRIPRTYLEKWLYEPYFDKVVTNSFVRISIGTVQETVYI